MTTTIDKIKNTVGVFPLLFVTAAVAVVAILICDVPFAAITAATGDTGKWDEPAYCRRRRLPAGSHKIDGQKICEQINKSSGTFVHM